MKGIYPLQGVVKHFDWGGYSFIPDLLAISNDKKLPFAEYWLGSHPQGMSKIVAGNEEKELSTVTGHLSFLLKVLDVKDMLSIQVHPSKPAAERGFARENAEGIPLDSPQRNYKDTNHKPELMVALGDFWLLHGFKPKEALVDTLLNVKELRELLPVFNASGYSGLYRHVMEMPQQEVNRILQPLLLHLTNMYKNKEPGKHTEDYWVVKAAKKFTRNDNIDRGIFSIYLFNLVHLKKGEGIFQAEGIPHAYLEGQNVEIMSNSDNVLRGGLTTKQINVKEFLTNITYQSTYPALLSGEYIGQHLIKYPVPVSDFKLEKIGLGLNDCLEHTAESPEILLLTEGEISIANTGLVLKKGNPAAVVLPATSYRLCGKAASTVVFRASGQILSR